MLIGLTGGIGSGKSTVANLFADLGITIIDADVIAREVVMPDMPALKAIVHHFGSDLLDHTGHLNRSALRNRIFSNPPERLWLEQLLHPQIINEIKNRAKTSTARYCIAVVPLLLETQSHLPVDRVLVVDAPVELQRQRMKERDKLSDDMIDSMLSAQLSREKRLAAADDVIGNDKGLEKLKQQVQQLHESYLKKI